MIVVLFGRFALLLGGVIMVALSLIHYTSATIASLLQALFRDVV